MCRGVGNFTGTKQTSRYVHKQITTTPEMAERNDRMKTITDLENAAVYANYILNTKGGIATERDGKFEVYGEESGGPEERLACELSEDAAIDAATTYLERIANEATALKIHDELINYAANTTTCDTFEKFSIPDSAERAEVLADFTRNFFAVKIDDDGPSPEQDEKLENILSAYATSLMELRK